MTIKLLPFHPLATMFPPMTDEEFEGLVKDIHENGQRQDIVVWQEQILEGVHRAKACQILPIEPRYDRTKRFTDEAGALAFVVSQNLHRRHLNTSQRAMIAAKIATMKHGGDRKSDQDANLRVEKSKAEAAEMLKVSPKSVEHGKTVLNSGDAKLIKQVETGKVKVSAAAKSVKPRPPISVRSVISKPTHTALNPSFTAAEQQAQPKTIPLSKRAQNAVAQLAADVGLKLPEELRAAEIKIIALQSEVDELKSAVKTPEWWKQEFNDIAAQMAKHFQVNVIQALCATAIGLKKAKKSTKATETAS
jgi:hypothetical protein